MGLVGCGWEEVGVVGGRGFGFRGREREEGRWEEEEVLVLSATDEVCCRGSKKTNRCNDDLYRLHDFQGGDLYLTNIMHHAHLLKYFLCDLFSSNNEL